MRRQCHYEAKLTQQIEGILCFAGHEQKPVIDIRDARRLRRSTHTSACCYANVIGFVVYQTERLTSREEILPRKIVAAVR